LTVNEWLAERADRLATAAGVDRSLLDLDPAAIDELLDLARVAAHESGDRRNAPLICYLVGLARTSGRSLQELSAEAH
jgi:hypothetical protein